MIAARVSPRRPTDYRWARGVPGDAPAIPLTARQQEMIACLWLGLTNQEIGRRFDLAPNAARNALWRAYRRLGVAGRPDPRTVAAVLLWQACDRATAQEG